MDEWAPGGTRSVAAANEAFEREAAEMKAAKDAKDRAMESKKKVALQNTSEFFAGESKRDAAKVSLT